VNSQEGAALFVAAESNNLEYRVQQGAIEVKSAAAQCSRSFCCSISCRVAAFSPPPQAPLTPLPLLMRMRGHISINVPLEGLRAVSVYRLCADTPAPSDRPRCASGGLQGHKSAGAGVQLQVISSRSGLRFTLLSLFVMCHTHVTCPT
jgi:hypothetical protein